MPVPVPVLQEQALELQGRLEELLVAALAMEPQLVWQLLPGQTPLLAATPAADCWTQESNRLDVLLEHSLPTDAEPALPPPFQT